MADEPTEPESSTDDTTSDDATSDTTTSTDSNATDEGPVGAAATDDGPVGAAKDANTKKDAKASAPAVKRKVVSKRVTPKGGGPAQSTGRATRASGGATKGSTAAHAHSADGDDAGYSSRYTPPTAKYAAGPSPWWVPALMFGLLILGALIIMLNYMGVFGDADNIRLIIGLAFILGGIITATQLR